VIVDAVLDASVQRTAHFTDEASVVRYHLPVACHLIAIASDELLILP
jgi:hypothetical protein